MRRIYMLDFGLARQYTNANGEVGFINIFLQFSIFKNKKQTKTVDHPMHLFEIFNFQNENKNGQSSLSCSGPASPSSCGVPRNGQIRLDQRAQEQGDG